jgi:pantetheine-phosphate adenylyltransferase
MIEQAAGLFEKVIVAIGANSEKKPMFPLRERIAMLAEMAKGLPNVSIEAFEGQLAVGFARSQNAKFMVRGIRNAGDFEYERLMRNVNSDLDPEIETLFLIPPRELAEVSSSLVRGLIGLDGWEDAVAKFVPENVSAKIKELKQ